MGFARKLKRKQLNAARKQFMKDFKKQMKKFKSLVACSACGRPPAEGENIDNWKINKQSENIDLLCLNCFDSEEIWKDEV
tara:strand:- start:728 stop:967 length:240 start_codon:yes stop_codon:yes gene_type:complete